MFSVVFVLSIFCAHFAAGAKPWEPQPGSASWLQHHQRLLAQTLQHKNDIKAIFIGASGTEYWLNEGRPIWDSYYAKHGSANYGIGGDTTSNVLWRIQNKELDGLNPKVVVLSAGPGFNMMNSNSAVTGAEMLRGVEEMIKELRAKFTKSKLIIFGHTPYQIRSAIDSASKHNNIELKKLADNKDVFFFDLSPQLLNANGQIKTEMFKNDHLHLSLAGYTLLDHTLRPMFEKLIK